MSKSVFIFHKDYGIGKLVFFSPFMGVGVSFSKENQRFFSTAERNLANLSVNGTPLAVIVNREMRNPAWHLKRQGSACEQMRFSSLPIWPAEVG